MVSILYTINIIVTDMIPRTAYVCAMHIVHVSVCVYVHMCVCVRVCVCTRRDAHCTLSRVSYLVVSLVVARFSTSPRLLVSVTTARVAEVILTLVTAPVGMVSEVIILRNSYR